MTELAHAAVRRIADTLGKPMTQVSSALLTEGIETMRPPTNVERLNELYAEWATRHAKHMPLGEFFAQQGVKAVRENS